MRRAQGREKTGTEGKKGMMCDVCLEEEMGGWLGRVEREGGGQEQ